MKAKSLVAAALGHFTIDCFSNVLPIMYPLLATSLTLSYGQVALIATTYSTTVAICQPIFGHVADHIGGKWLAALSITLATSMMALTGLAPNYPLLLLFVALAGIGSGIYHPQGSVSASISGGGKRGTAMSIFSFGGTAGAAAGPVIGAALIVPFGLSGTAWFIIPGVLVTIAFFFLSQALPKKIILPGHEELPSSFRSIPWRSLVSLLAVIALRGWAILALTTFIPLLLQNRGYGVDVSSRVLFVMMVAASGGILLGGYLSDRIGRRPVILLTMALVPPLYLMALVDNLALTFIIIALLGVLLEGSIPVTVVMSQELMPRNIGMVSGLALGIGLIAGAIGVSITGNIADSIGLEWAFSMVAALPAIAAFASIWLPKPSKRPIPPDATPVV